MTIRLTQAVVERVVREVETSGRRQDLTDGTSRGLALRVSKGSGARWCLRGRSQQKSWRLDIGSYQTWSIAEARRMASDAVVLISDRRGLPDAAWLDRQLRLYRKLDAEGPATVSPATWSKWTWAQARDHYLAWVKDHCREATLRDKRGMLTCPELRALNEKRVALITRREIAEIVDRVHRSGRERQAEHIVEVVRPFFGWLGHDARSGKSGVEADVMAALKKPERTLKEDAQGRSLGVPLYVPPPAEVGGIICATRSGALDPTIARAIALKVYSGQRRRTVGSARIERFEEVPGFGGVWHIPAAHRKTAARFGDPSNHVIPLPGSAWRPVAEQLERLGETEGWLFPALRTGKNPNWHIHLDTLTHIISALPGPGAAHDLRRAFGTNGRKAMGLSRSDVKLILDHSENGRTSDVTEAHYSFDEDLATKTPIMEGWVKLCDAWAAMAEPSALGEDALRDYVYAHRRLKHGSADLGEKNAPKAG